MTLSALDAKLEAIEQATELRRRIFSGELVGLQLELSKQKLLEVEKQLYPDEAQGRLEVRREIAALDRAEAAKRAAELRQRPEYFRPDARKEDGSPVATPQARAALLREHQELMAHAHPDQGG